MVYPRLVYCRQSGDVFHARRLHSRSILSQRRRWRDAGDVAGKNEADGLLRQHRARDVFAGRDVAGGTGLRGDEPFLEEGIVQGG